ncbi:hypothetical protein [Pseudomonas duriflava]|uniref:hypothetical protein n=1 Tax=Pseudomonas duriflava TaxID=459528 RepID=UPI00131548F5|nr:hypothetical protein [Pseudomonas duriflava]
MLIRHSMLERRCIRHRKQATSNPINQTSINGTVPRTPTIGNQRASSVDPIGTSALLLP